MNVRIMCRYRSTAPPRLPGGCITERLNGCRYFRIVIGKVLQYHERLV